MNLSRSKIFSYSNLLIFTGVLLLRSAFSPSMASDELGEDPFLEEFPVVLSVTRLPQKTNEVPASVTIIDREMIEASGAIEIADLFRLVPGFQVGHYHHFEGERTVVTYHGISDQYSRRMQVLIDGRSVYLPSTGGVMWNDLPITLHEIERIEVTRGPNGATYGMNSFQGVINIITQAPGEIDKTELYSLVGTNDLANITLQTAGNSDNFQYKFTTAYERDSGFDGVNDDSESVRINTRGDYQIGVNDTISLALGGVVGSRQAGFVYDPTSPPSEDSYVASYFSLRDQKVTSSYQQINYSHIISSDDEIKVQLYHSVRNGKDQYDTEKPSVIIDAGGGDGSLFTALPPIAVNLVLVDEQSDIEISHQLRISENLRAIWGGEFRIDRFRGYDYVNTSDTFVNKSKRFFINTEWQPGDNWVVNFGDMLEKTDYISKNHSPRLSITRLLGAYYIRAVRSQAWRSPGFLENEFDYTITIVDPVIVYPQLLGSSDLKAEKIVSSELAFGGNNLKSRLNYELRLFREEMSDLIDTPGAPEVIANDGYSDVRGTEFQVKWRPSEDTLVHMSYSHINADGTYGGRNIEELIPTDTFNILISQKLDRYSRVGINYSQVSKMRFGTKETELDGYSILNIKYDHELKIVNQPATFSLIGRELMGEYGDYNANHFVVSPQYYIGLSLGF